MTARKLAAVAAAGLTLAAASATVANASTPAATPDINGYFTDFTGTGSTLALAEQNALYTSAEYGCSGLGTLVSSSESAGVWTAVMKTYCSWNPDAAR